MNWLGFCAFKILRIPSPRLLRGVNGFPPWPRDAAGRGKRFVLPAILSFLLLYSAIPIARAANLPLIEDVLRGGKTSERVVEKPDPVGLEAEWWHYFDAKDAELDHLLFETIQKRNEESKIHQIPKFTPWLSRVEELAALILWW